MDLRALTISFHSDDKIKKKDEEKKPLKSKQMKNMKSKFYKFSFIENSCQKGFLKTKGNDNPAYIHELNKFTITCIHTDYL